MLVERYSPVGAAGDGGKKKGENGRVAIKKIERDNKFRKLNKSDSAN